MNFAILAIPSLIVVLIMKYCYDHKITLREVLIHSGIVVVASLFVLMISYAANYSSLGDVQILNGQVTNKFREVETCTQYSSCKHYWIKEKCRYYRDNKGKRQKSCTSYKVFDYPYEVDWYVQTTVGNYTIERVNRQGTMEPQRWSVVKKGDYAATENGYINYLFSDENSLFSSDDKLNKFDPKYVERLPKYPTINDYYKTYHVINTTKVDSTGFNEYIENELKTMGAIKQVNIQVLIYNYKDIDFVEATLQKWRGGKKNDVIMFFGVDEDGVVQNFTSTSFAQGMKNEELHAQLRIDALKEKLTLDLIKKEVHNINQKFKRLENKEFEYLATKMEPRKDVMIIASIFLLILSVFVGFYMRDNEL